MKMTREDLVRDRFVAAGMSTAAIVSVVVFALAAASYPGGTHFDHDARGHDFWLNTLCDVARSTAIGGRPNGVGASLAQTAMTSFALALALLFWLVPRQFPSRPRLGLAVRAVGALSVPGTLAVTFLPSDRFSGAHSVAIVVAAVPGIAAVFLAAAGLVREARSPALAGLACLSFGAGAADFLLYSRELLLGTAPQVAVSILERVTSLLLVGWVLVLARATVRSCGHGTDHLPGRFGGHDSSPDRPHLG